MSSASGSLRGPPTKVPFLQVITKKVPDPALTAIAVVAVALIVAILAKCCGDSWKGHDPRFANRIESMLKDSARLQTMSNQDKNALLAYLHANQAVYLIRVCRSLASDLDIKRMAGIDVDEINKRAMHSESRALSRLSDQYPNLVPKGLIAGRVGTSSWI